MPVPLPPELVTRLGDLLGDELPELLAAYRDPPVRGLRVNTRKIDRAGLAELLGIDPDPVPWAPTGLRIPDGVTRLGDSLVNRAGLCYLQEPSAMSPAEALDVTPGACVIDLAAAPGGKTTRLTELVGPDGLVVANDVSRRRLGVLHENLDRWGPPANVVTVSRPVADLAELAPAAFDAALLDAPCSGEGMIRRDPRMGREWSLGAVRGAARRQAGLLTAAAGLVRPGGVLVYSTCTFGVEENEERIAAFLADRPEWQIEDAVTEPGFARGAAVGGQPTELSARLWPHRVCGEGHFVARLRHSTSRGPHVPGEPPGQTCRAGGRRGGNHPMPAPTVRHAAHIRAAWARFRSTSLIATDGLFRSRAAVGETASDDEVVVRHDRVYRPPVAAAPLPQEILARPGLPLGRLRPGRFEPSPALAGLLGRDQVADAADWPVDDPRWAAYLTGAQLPDPGPDGWVLVCAYGWGVGWARRRGGVLKNFLPPALRRPP